MSTERVQMVCRDVWLKYTSKDGKSRTQYHRVWDIGLFMAARESDALKENYRVEQVLPPERTGRK